jgi:hypothetical protein
MSIKFRQNDKVDLQFSFISNESSSVLGNVSIKIGPIIDRVNCMKKYYELFFVDLTDITTIHDICDKKFNKFKNTNGFKISYKMLKDNFKISHATELEFLRVPMTNQDLMDDLDFMKDEIIKCQINMNLLKQKNDQKKYDFYNQLINHKQHIMFQVPTLQEYSIYLDKISKLIVDNKPEIEKQNMTNVMAISNTMW